MTPFLFAQARFPAPEFDTYRIPELVMEEAVFDSSLLRAGAIVLFMLCSGICFYRLRSRKALLLLHLLGLVVFGFLFHACPCPVGIVQNIAEGAATGAPLPLAFLLLFTLPLLCALFYGRLFCAGACPLGALQELMPGKKLRLPPALDRFLRLGAVLVLLLVLVCAVAGIGFPLCRLDPYLPIFLRSFNHPYLWLTVVFLLLGLLISRPFCRYLCPYGVLLRLFSLLSWKKPIITTHDCINCRLCLQGCPNNAIIAPENDDSPAQRKRGLRRLELLLASIPLALALGGFLGYAAAPLLYPQHRAISLEQKLQRAESALTVDAYEKSQRPAAELSAAADRGRRVIRTGLTLAGLLFAAWVMAELIVQARRRPEENIHRIDHTLCFCCGRCYQTCPLEKPRLSQQDRKT